MKHSRDFFRDLGDDILSQGLHDFLTQTDFSERTNGLCNLVENRANDTVNDGIDRNLFRGSWVGDRLDSHC